MQRLYMYIRMISNNALPCSNAMLNKKIADFQFARKFNASYINCMIWFSIKNEIKIEN